MPSKSQLSQYLAKKHRKLLREQRGEEEDEDNNNESQTSKEEEISILKGNLTVSEMKFARNLGAIEKKHRDKGVKILSSWLSKNNSVDYVDLLKIWKALFYCFWLTDKPFIQEELATNLSQLMHSMVDNGLNFAKAFFHTIEREWPFLDQIRLDKFLSMNRKFFTESLKYLHKRKWNASVVNAFNTILLEGPLNPKSEQNGVKLHIIDIFLEEVYNVGGEELPSDTLTSLLTPFLQLISIASQKVVLRKVREKIFVSLVDDWQQPPSGYVMDEDEEKLPFLQVDFSTIASILGQLASATSTVDTNRQMIYSLQALFEQVVESRDVVAQQLLQEDQQLEEPSKPKKKPKKKFAKAVVWLHS